MESQRQKKIASVLQKDLVEVLQGAAREGGMSGVIISVTQVKVTVDLSIAKVYLSIFPIKQAKVLIDGIASKRRCGQGCLPIVVPYECVDPMGVL